MGTGKKRKEITFDLNQAKLQEFYPKPANSKDELFYKKAYKDIRRFMMRNGFLWRQGSVYVSLDKMTRVDTAGLAMRMAQTLPWLEKCVSAIDVADISERQYSLLDYLKRVDEVDQDVQIEPISNREAQTPSVRKPDLQDQIIKAKAKTSTAKTPIKVKVTNRGPIR